VSAESKDEKNFHWVYVMKKQPRWARKTEEDNVRNYKVWVYI
jgi:hypothetical protein